MTNHFEIVCSPTDEEIEQALIQHQQAIENMQPGDDATAPPQVLIDAAQEAAKDLVDQD